MLSASLNKTFLSLMSVSASVNVVTFSGQAVVGVRRFRCSYHLTDGDWRTHSRCADTGVFAHVTVCMQRVTHTALSFCDNRPRRGDNTDK